MNGPKTTGFMAMKSAGYYSKATVGAKHVMDNATQMVLDAVQAMGLEDDTTSFRATDMGAADGGTSIDLWRQVLGKVSKTAPSKPIEMIYTDLPRNDFSQLFQIVHGLTDIPSYLPEIPNLFVSASATGFHHQIVPTGTLDLGFSATASHYIEAVPQNIESHVHMVGANLDEQRAYQSKGAKDWERMLLHRSRELKAGGRLCLFNFGIDSEGRYLGNTGGQNMFDTFALLWQKLADEGVITHEEFAGTNFPQVYRTQEEFVAPFSGSSEPVFSSGLRLERVESRVVRCPFERDYTENHKDSERFSREYIPTLRSWSEPTFTSGLSNTRSVAERTEIIDEFYRRYQKRVANNPEGHAMDYVHIYLVCEKVE